MRIPSNDYKKFLNTEFPEKLQCFLWDKIINGTPIQRGIISAEIYFLKKNLSKVETYLVPILKDLIKEKTLFRKNLSK